MAAESRNWGSVPAGAGLMPPVQATNQILHCRLPDGLGWRMLFGMPLNDLADCFSADFQANRRCQARPGMRWGPKPLAAVAVQQRDREFADSPLEGDGFEPWSLAERTCFRPGEQKKRR